MEIRARPGQVYFFMRKLRQRNRKEGDYMACKGKGKGGKKGKGK